MDINITCLKCRRRFKAGHPDLRIYGPVIHVKCPFCKKEMSKNFSRFIETQVKKPLGMRRFELVSEMVSFSRELEKEIFHGH